MTTPAKATPAKAAKKAAPTAPAYDFKTVEIADSTAPVREYRGEKLIDNTAFEKAMEDSWNRKRDTGRKNSGVPVFLGHTKEIVIPRDALKDAQNRIRYAADTLARKLGQNIGSTISEPLTMPGGRVKVSFAAKTRKNPRKEKVATPAVPPAEVVKETPSA